MLNVNELTARMAKMSDDQLRQYAQLHKDDPYTLALASSESKRRAQLRAGGQQGAQGQQPTVADQALAQMGAPAPMPQAQPQPQAQAQLPENQGIGMLPAANMAGMADGGIAGYDDEYAAGGMIAFAGGGMTPEEKAELERYQREKFESLYGLKDWASGVKKDITDWFTADRSNIPFESKSPLIKYKTPKNTGVFEYERPQAALEREREERGITPPNAPPVSDVYYDEGMRGSAASTKPSADKPPAPAPKSKARGPYADSPAGRKAADNQPGTKTTTEPSGFVPTRETDLASELQRLEALSPGVGAYDVLANKIEQGYDKLQKEREASRPTGKPYEGLEALLAKEEEKAKGKEARNFNMAIINAGLAIAGGKSQYALQNIAEGAQVGTKQYQEGLEKLEAAAVERRKQAALIEEARRAEARGDWKENAMFKQQAFEAGLNVKKSQIDASMNLFGINQKAAVDLVNTAQAQAAADKRALMQEQHADTRAREQNITSKEVARIYAAMRASAGPSLADKAYDNATRQHQLWLNSPEGKVESMTPGAADRKFLYYLEQANKGLGVSAQPSVGATANDPYAGWGNPQVTSPKK